MSDHSCVLFLLLLLSISDPLNLIDKSLIGRLSLHILTRQAGVQYKFTVDPIISLYIEKPITLPVLIFSGQMDIMDTGENYLPLMDLFVNRTYAKHPWGKSFVLEANSPTH